MKSRRFFIWLYAFILCSGIIAVPALAEQASGKCGDNLTWILDDNGTLTINGTGEMYDYDDISFLYEYRHSLKDIVFSEGITSIGANVFCFPGQVRINGVPLGEFYNCAVKIPKSVKVIGEDAFFGTNIRSVEIEGTDTIIEKNAFCGSEINSVVIEGIDTVVGEKAFMNCEKLSNIDIAAKDIGENAFSGCKELKTVTLRSGIQTIREGAFSGCSSLTSIRFPEGVTEIGDIAFYADHLLEEMYLPRSIKTLAFTSIGSKFSITAGYSAETEEEIKELKETLDAAYNSMKPLNIYYSGTKEEFGKIEVVNDTISETVEKSGFLADPEGKYESYETIPGIKYYKPPIIVHCSDGIYKRTSPTEPENPAPNKGDTFKTVQGTYSFNGKEGEITLKKVSTNAVKITIPASEKYNGKAYKITEIAVGAFQKSKVKEVSIGSNVKTIGKNAFKECTRLTKVTGGKNVKQIGNSAFEGCKKLKSVTIGSNVTSIGAKAYSGCVSIKKITIPAKVKEIGASAFLGDKKLKTVTIKTTKLSTKKVGKNAFKGISAKATIKVPKKVLKAYKKWLIKKGVPRKAKIE